MGDLTVEELTSELENLKKDASGKDRTISRLMKELEQSRSVESDPALAEELARLREICVKLKERETSLEVQERAMKEAVEKGIPVKLALRGAKDWAAFEQELTEFAEAVLAGKRMPHSAIGKLLEEKLGLDASERPQSLNYAAVGKLTRKEIAQIPDTILAKLRERK